MNFKQVLKAYAILHQLTDDESALLETLRGLSEGEREQLVESLSPGKVAKKAAAKPRTYEHCARCDKTKGHGFHKDSSSDSYHQFQQSKPKSQRAASLAEQIKSAGKPRSDSEKGSPCTTCDFDADHNIHHLESAEGYHEFQPAQAAAATGD